MTTDFTSVPLVHTIPGTADVIVERDHHYPTEHGPLAFDLYRPPHATPTHPGPAVVIVSGLPDPGVIAMLGKPLKDWRSYQDWGRLFAASGVTAVLYQNRTPADVTALLRHLRDEAAALGLDPARLGVFAASGHVPTALAVIAREPTRTAALLYGYTLDLDGATDVAEAAKQLYFATPPVTLDQLPATTPLLLVRARRDVTPGLDAALVRFVAAARARGLPVTLIEHADAPHAFDLIDDSPRTHVVIDEVLAFVRRTLA